MNSGREIILGRIREALQIAAPHPGDHSTNPENPGIHHHSRREWLPLVGEGLEDQIALFQSNCDALKAQFELVDHAVDAQSLLLDMAQNEGWKKLAFHKHPLLEPFARTLAGNGVHLVDVDAGYEKSDLEACDAGLTICEALVAQTGSILVASTTCGGRALSVLPPHHVVVATRNQLHPDLELALAFVKEKFGDNQPSMLSFITGPSRTGDIERILVLGAHGPKKLTILLLP